jgi:prepilin peptidase CpaA
MPTIHLDGLVLGSVLAIATVTDLRRREVPLWLTFGAITVGLIAGLLDSRHGAVATFIGLAAGIVPPLPFVLLGGLGAGDLLLFASIGVWEGWHFVLSAIWWTAVVGALLALGVRVLGRRSLPYVPAILVGAILAYVTMPA